VTLAVTSAGSSFMTLVTSTQVRFARLALASAALAATVAPAVPAQSAQPFAVVLSGVQTTIAPGDRRIPGGGVQLMQRFSRAYASETFGAVSLGLGGQYSRHVRASDRLDLSSLIIEPRWVPLTGTSRVFPFLAFSTAVQRVSGRAGSSDSFAGTAPVRGSAWGVRFGVGGGAALRLTRRINADASLQYVRQTFGRFAPSVSFDPTMTYAATLGVSIGYPR